MPESTPTPLDAAQVAHLGELARITLTAEEIDTLTDELRVIIESMAKVSEIVTPDIPGTSHPIRLSNAFRADVPGETLTVEQVLSDAPEREGDLFRVSEILEEEQ